MLHLNVVKADLACASHAHGASSHGPSSHADQEHASAASHPMSMHHEQAVGSAVGSTESCDAPVQADCCQALVTCSVAPGLNVTASSMSAPMSHDVVPAAPQTAPLSRNGAPEPPPPKL